MSSTVAAVPGSEDHLPPRIILDTDVGIDDAQALMLAVKFCRLEAVTTVFGNVPLEQATRNACKLLHMWGRSDIPVYAGAAHPVAGPVAEAVTASHVHGETGLGFAVVPDAGQPGPGFAPDRMVELVRAYPHQLTLVAIGPLTNVALALRMEPALGSLLKRFVFLGGAIRGMGNITAAAEFNVFCDPEGAAEVFRGMDNIEMISWEPILDASVPWEWLEQWISIDTARGRLMRDMCRFYMQMLRVPDPPFPCQGYPFGDPMAVAAVVRPDYVVHSERRRVEVECGGTLTRGQTVVEWRQPAALGQGARPPNVRLVLRVDNRVLQQLLMEAVLDSP